jgi:NADH-quinone oxidoreductase subunit J
MNIIFYIAATVALISTILAISRPNAIHALLFLILSLLSISVIFYIIGAPFIAALEIIVYAGAIMVLFIFVIMMLNVGLEKAKVKQLMRPSIWILPALLALILFADFIYMLSELHIQPVNGRIILPKEVGISLFTTYLIGVEIAAILLLAGIVGAYHMGRQRKKVMHRFLQKEEVIQPEKETV